MIEKIQEIHHLNNDTSWIAITWKTIFISFENKNIDNYKWRVIYTRDCFWSSRYIGAVELMT